MATINIKPTKAAIGNCSIKPEPNIIKTSSITEATMPDNLALAPAEVLIKLCPIIAQPPIPDKNPEAIFAVPCAMHSRFPFPRVSVISSIKFKVNKLSIKPTPATMQAKGNIIFKVSKSRGIFGIPNGGNPPLILSPAFNVSATDIVSIPNPMAMADTTKIAIKDEGTTLVNFGNPQIISIVNKVNPSIVSICVPCNKLSVPF